MSTLSTIKQNRRNNWKNRKSEGDSQSAHEYEVVQQPAYFSAGRGGDDLPREWGDEVVDFEAHQGAFGDGGFDAGAHAAESLGLVRSGEKGEALERLRESGGAGAAINFHSAASRHKRTDFRSGGSEVHHKIVMNGVSLAAEGGLGAAARHLQISGQVFVTQLAAEELVHVAAQVGAHRRAGLEPDIGAAGRGGG